MAVVNIGRTRRPVRFTSGGDGYTPHQIGEWIATDARELPWVTIGQALEGSSGTGTTVKTLMTAADILAATNLDINVRKVHVTDPETGKPIPKMFATCYDDADPDVGRVYFGAVSDKYEVVRPSDTLSVFDEIVKAVPGAGYSAAWNMHEKAMMGVTIELPKEVVIDPDGANDRIGLHLLGINSFDGSTGLSGSLITTRWWCMNQLVPTLHDAKRGFSLRHTRNVATRAYEAADRLGLVWDYADKLDAVGNQLYRAAMSDRAFETFLAKLPQFHLDGGETELVEARVRDRRQEALAAWRAPHNANITGTRWGALNVVAEFVEWGRTVNGSRRTGTDPVRQRAIGTMVHPTVTGTVNDAMELLLAR